MVGQLKKYITKSESKDGIKIRHNQIHVRVLCLDIRHN
jgi:hypothetical protein